jgi:thymidylate kinase
MGGFVIVDGIDGSGKGVILQAFRDWVESKNLKSLDLREFCKENRRYPEPDEVEKYDVLFSSEPSYGYVGRAISEEIIKNNKRDYSVLSTAWAFALDREILYNRVIIPALKQDKYIFQERGVITSLVYQPVQGRIAFKQLIQMPGNRLALKYSPDLLFIARVEPKTVIERMKAQGKLGEAIFKSIHFQRKIDQRYASVWLKQLYERFKTKIHYIDTNPPKEIKETQKEVREIWERFVDSKEEKEKNN